LADEDVLARALKQEVSILGYACGENKVTRHTGRLIMRGQEKTVFQLGEDRLYIPVPFRLVLVAELSSLKTDL